MTAPIDRRLLLKTGMYGLGALGLQGGALAAMQVSMTRGFSHGVASGEPSQNSVLLWTRYASDLAQTKLVAEVSEQPDFRTIVGGADALATPTRDYTAKTIIRGLEPGRRYYYRFVAPDGSMSPVGRTCTLPEGKVDNFRMAVFSCANMPFGWFNAYSHAAQVGDFDIALHLGDYIYEYKRGDYPALRDAVAGRLIEPANEIVSLADYRLRYASYRADPDLQAIHARAPMLCMWDDHEFANDAYADGAENHGPNEGDWQERKRAAQQAWRDWMPVRDLGDGTYWSTYRVGELADIHFTESRIEARSKQTELEIPKGSDDAAAVAAIKAFRNGDWQSAERTMLGSKQESWLATSLQTSKARWNIWAQQTIVGTIKQPSEAENWLSPKAPDFAKARVKQGTLAASLGIPANLDAWDGYPAARARTLAAAQSAKADLIVLTGDTHNAWAFDLQHEGRAAGVELAGQSVSSPGLESYFTGAQPQTVANALSATNKGLVWADSSRRGYMLVELTPERTNSEWRFVETVKERSPRLAALHRMSTRHGRRRLG